MGFGDETTRVHVTYLSVHACKLWNGTLLKWKGKLWYYIYAMTCAHAQKNADHAQTYIIQVNEKSFDLKRGNIGMV